MGMLTRPTSLTARCWCPTLRPCHVSAACLHYKQSDIRKLNRTHQMRPAKTQESIWEGLQGLPVLPLCACNPPCARVTFLQQIYILNKGIAENLIGSIKCRPLRRKNPYWRAYKAFQFYRYVLVSILAP